MWTALCKTACCNGNLYVKGLGDPRLVMERLWLLLRRVQGMGIKTIAGDIVLDRSAFDLPEPDPAKFDGEPLRPYNVAPDALLINFKSVVMTLTPDLGAKVAQVQYDPPLAGVSLPATVPLQHCRGRLRRLPWSAEGRLCPTRCASVSEAATPRAVARRYGPSPTQTPSPTRTRRAGPVGEHGWQSAGSRCATAPVPAVLAGKPALVVNSATLAEVDPRHQQVQQQRDGAAGVSDLGPGSGYMPQGLPADVVADANLPPGSFAASRTLVQRWWKDRIGTDDAPVMDNGSGLSRQERITAQAMGRLLQATYAAPFMPELMSSLPITGVDGTLKRIKTRTSGTAHLKTRHLDRCGDAGRLMCTPSVANAMCWSPSSTTPTPTKPGQRWMRWWTGQGGISKHTG